MTFELAPSTSGDNGAEGTDEEIELLWVTEDVIRALELEDVSAKKGFEEALEETAGT